MTRRTFLPSAEQAGVATVYRQFLPPVIKEERSKKYHRDFWHAHPEYKEKDKGRKAKRYANDPEFRERCKQQERERWASLTPEERKEAYQRRKLKNAMLPEEEYLRRRKAASERQRKWRAKKKAERDAQA